MDKTIHVHFHSYLCSDRSELLLCHGTPYAPLPERLHQKALAADSHVRVSAGESEVRAEVSLAGAPHLQIVGVRVPSIAVEVLSTHAF